MSDILGRPCRGRVWLLTGASARISARMNCGRSAGVREEIRFPSTTTGLSSHSSPAFTRSSLIAPTLVPRLPRTIPAEIGTQPAWQMNATGLSGLVDLAA